MATPLGLVMLLSDPKMDDTGHTQQVDEHEVEEQQAEVREQAQQIWNNAEPAEHHLFFVCWRVSVNGLKVYRGDLTIDGVKCDGMLLVPMHDAERNLQNLTFLGLTERHYLAKDHFMGTYFGFGSHKPNCVIAITEGIIRGAKFHETSGRPVAVAFTAANVPNVKRLMRERYPDAKIVLVARDGSIQSADMNTHAADASGDSAAALGLAGEDAADEHSTAPAAATEPLQGESQAPPASCRTSEENALLKPESAEAQLLLNWIQRKELAELTRKQVMQFGPNSIRYAPFAKAALRALVRSGWLSTEDDSQYVLTPAASVTIGADRQLSP
jgi:hypothetical protein